MEHKYMEIRLGMSSDICDGRFGIKRKGGVLLSRRLSEHVFQPF